MKVKVRDSRNNKVYSGTLVTDIEVGKQVKVLLDNGTHELVIVPIQRCLWSGKSYWMTDKNGIKFVLDRA